MCHYRAVPRHSAAQVASYLISSLLSFVLRLSPFLESRVAKKQDVGVFLFVFFAPIGVRFVVVVGLRM